MSAVLEIEKIPEAQESEADPSVPAVAYIDPGQPLFQEWAVIALAVLRLDARQR